VTNKDKQMVTVKALNNINLNLKDGDRVGLIGHNGALLKLLSGIYEPTSGQTYTEGKIHSLFNIMIGIEQEYTGYENIYTRGVIQGLSKKEIEQQIDSIVEFTGLGDYLHIPTRTYSSGMMLRLAFAISVHIKPEILLIDEVFGAGDADFLQKARNKMASLLQKSNIVVMANHSNATIKKFCNKVIIMEAGHAIFFGNPEDAINKYENKVN
ncbi:ATP-binding cassette domain-containing protein, partial [Gammaproteobacteria bacterium]|nr:ATP-binding cassette domain-containing protein [Gammaproteobacteria bacterium]